MGSICFFLFCLFLFYLSTKPSILSIPITFPTSTTARIVHVFPRPILVYIKKYTQKKTRPPVAALRGSPGFSCVVAVDSTIEALVLHGQVKCKAFSFFCVEEIGGEKRAPHGSEEVRKSNGGHYHDNIRTVQGSEGHNEGPDGEGRISASTAAIAVVSMRRRRLLLAPGRSGFAGIAPINVSAVACP